MSAPSSRHLGTASMLGAASQIITLAIGLWATPEFVHGLGDATYGVLAIVTSFTSYFAYLELGLGSGYHRDLSMALARGDHARAQATVETAFALYLRVGLVGAALMVAVGWPYLGAAVADPALAAQARFSIVILALTFLLTMALSAARGVVFASQRFDLYTRVALFVQPLVPLTQIFALRRGAGLGTILLIQTAGALIIDSASVLIARSLQPHLRFRPRFHRHVWHEIRSFSLFKFVYQVAEQGQLSADRLLLGTMVPIAAVTPYAVAASIAQRLRVVAIALSTPFLAAAAAQWTTGGATGLGALLVRFSRRISVLMALGSAGAIFLARPFLSAWVGPAYSVQGTSIMRLMVIATALLVFGSLSATAVDAAGGAQKTANAAIIRLVVSVGISIPLVLRFQAVGAAWGFLIGTLVFTGYSISLIARYLGRPVAIQLAATSLGRPTAVGLIAYAVMASIPHGPGLAATVIPSTGGTLAGLFSAVLLGCLSREDLPVRFQNAAG